MERLSRPLSDLREHYDVVVVGSGYGGGIAASRLQRAGAQVCVLERGKELHPGEYPARLSEAAPHIQARTRRHHFGSKTALLDFHLGEDISVLVGCGLGGTSLINANVALRAKPWIFKDSRWPKELRDDGAEILAPYYADAEKMLGSTPYPEDWPELPKLVALERSAKALGAHVDRPNINVTFEAGPNAARVMQEACTLCGDCVSGCNHRAKNTVLMNYLPDAHGHGAHIFTEVGVRTVGRRGENWLVQFETLDEGRRRFGPPTQFVRADVVVLAAGTLGSTEILLRSGRAGLEVSEMVGHHFSGNGDVLAFAFDTDASVRAVGLGDEPARAGTVVGPCITGMIDLTERPAPDKGMLIQEGSVPGVLGPIVGPAWAALAAVFGRDSTHGWERAVRRFGELIGSLAGPRHGPASRSLTYLVMSTDDDKGRIRLDGDHVRVLWAGVGERPVFRRDNDAVEAAATALGGTYLPSPTWTTPFGHSLMTVHPIGGCVMGDHAGRGVVDHRGRVFAGTTGAETHEGLYVLDGSIIPRPLGVNPSLTISALAERACKLLADEAHKQKKWTATRHGPRKKSDLAGLHFTERMEGYISTAVSEGYEEGFAQGQADASRIEFILTISYEDLDRALREPDTRAKAWGTVVAPELSPHRMVAEGSFRLLVEDDTRVETWRMKYSLKLRTEDGREYRFRGFKVIRKRGSLHAWPNTTTLYTTIEEPDTGRNLGVGIMRIRPADFVRQLRTITVDGVADPAERQRYRTAFMRMFAGSLLRIYGGALDEAGAFPKIPGKPVPPREGGRKLDLPEPVVFRCGLGGTWRTADDTQDDDWLRLVHYPVDDDRKGKGPVMLAPGYGMAASSYLATTTKRNLAEHLHQAGYDTWLFDYRAGIELPSASKDDFTFDDVAREDWPTGIRKVLEETKADKVQVFAHCFGAMSFFMAMLHDRTLKDVVRSAVCSQVTPFLEPSLMLRVKNALHVGDILDGVLGIRRVRPDNRRTLKNEALDVLLRIVPTPQGERCGQAVCRWINAMYGCTHRHAQLNEATHEALNDMFGVGILPALEHAALMLKMGHVVDHKGRNVYLREENAVNLKIPIMLLQGTHNHIFLPPGSERTIKWLRDHNPEPGLYERTVLRGYAHLDGLIGRDAHRDVFPKIVQFLNKTARAKLSDPQVVATPQ